MFVWVIIKHQTKVVFSIFAFAPVESEGSPKLLNFGP